MIDFSRILVANKCKWILVNKWDSKNFLGASDPYSWRPNYSWNRNAIVTVLFPHQFISIYAYFIILRIWRLTNPHLITSDKASVSFSRGVLWGCFDEKFCCPKQWKLILKLNWKSVASIIPSHSDSHRRDGFEVSFSFLT